MPGALGIQDRVCTVAAALGIWKLVIVDRLSVSSRRIPLWLLATSKYSVDRGSHSSANTPSCSSGSDSSSPGDSTCLLAFWPVGYNYIMWTPGDSTCLLAFWPVGYNYIMWTPGDSTCLLAFWPVGYNYVMWTPGDSTCLLAFWPVGTIS